jgi:UDP-N-acetylglucosamine diphosphorylase/glucosamine-1-phosphate N-acetyltransferase
MNYILFDSARRINLLPLTFMRPMADIRIGIMTVREKWEKFLDSKTSSLTEDYLSAKFPLITTDNNILISGAVCPTKALLDQILKLKLNESLIHEGNIIAFRTKVIDKNTCLSIAENFGKIDFKGDLLKIENTWDLFAKNAEAIEQDFEFLTSNKQTQNLDSFKFKGSKENIYIHPEAKVKHAFLNNDNGPIYLDKGSEVMEGAMIRGPFYLGENSSVKMGAKIYGPTTIGPNCKVGGEINNVVMFAHSNKGHEGFLGNAVIGEWCNIGADTNNSNLKNTYDNVKLWSYDERKFVDTKLQFCGLIMGDHSKTGINTMFNTGTVVGVASNIFGSGYQRNFIPSFSWGGPTKMIKHDLKRAIITADQVYKRRNLEFSKIDKELFSYLHSESLKDAQI